ncbi:MAG: hypothetical protein ACOH5I_26190 [Oligoflexus sp.]
MSRKIALGDILGSQKNAPAHNIDILRSGNDLVSNSKSGASKSEASKTEASKTEASKTGASKTGASKLGASKTEISDFIDVTRSLIHLDMTLREMRLVILLLTTEGSPSLDDLDRDLGFARTVTLKTIKSLCKKEFLRKEKGKGRYGKTNYILTI